MTSDILKEYVKLALERVRNAEFSIDRLKSICDSTPDVMKKRKYALRYCNALLDVIGAGSSRCTFRYSSSKVLKVAMNDGGRVQNAKELAVYGDPAAKNVITTIYDHDAANTWLLSEIVRPLQSSNEFYELLGMDAPDLQIINFIRYVLHPDAKAIVGKGKNVRVKRVREVIEPLLTPEAEKFANNLATFIHKNNMNEIELTVVGHWGKTADGRLVLLDYGLDADASSNAS